MIFRTITDESTGAVKSIGLFGKTLNDFKLSFASIKTNGLLNSIFKTSSIDTKAIDAYNKAISEAIKNNISMADKQLIMKTAIEETNEETARLISSAKGAEVGLKELKAAQDATTLSAKAGQVALKGLTIAGNMLAFIGIAFVFETLAKAIYSAVNAQKIAIEKAKEQTDKNKQTVSTISELIQKYKELKESETYQGEHSADILEIQNQIKTSIGEQANSVDLVNGNLENQLKILNDINDKNLEILANSQKSELSLLKEETKASPIKSAKDSVVENIPVLSNWIGNGSKQSKTIAKILNEIGNDKVYKNLFGEISFKGVKNYGNVSTLEELFTKEQFTPEEIYSYVSDIKIEIEKALKQSNLSDTVKEEYKNALQYIDQYVNEYGEKVTAIQNLENEYYQTLAKRQAKQFIDEKDVASYEDYIFLMEKINSQNKSFSFFEGENLSLEEQKKLIKDLIAVSYPEYEKKLNEINSTFAHSSEDAFTIINKMKTNSEDLAESMTKIIDDTINKINTAKSIIEEWDKNKAFDSSSIKSILEAYPELSSEVSKYLSGLSDEETLINKLREAEKQAISDYKDDMKLKTATQEQSVYDWAILYNKDLSNYENFNSLKEDVVNTFLSTWTNNNENEIKALKEQYGQDLENYKEVAKAKIEVAKATMINSGSAYDIYSKSLRDKYNGSLMGASKEELNKLKELQDTHISAASEFENLSTLDKAINKINSIKVNNPNIPKDKSDKSPSSSSKGSKSALKTNDNYYNQFQAILDDYKSNIEKFESEIESLNTRLTKAIDTGNTSLAEQLNKEIESKTKAYQDYVAKSAQSVRGMTEKQILPIIWEIAPQLKGKKYSDITEQELLKVQKALDDAVISQENVEVNAKNAGNDDADNSSAIKSAEMRQKMFDSLLSTLKEIDSVAGNSNGSGEWSEKWAEGIEKILENAKELYDYQMSLSEFKFTIFEGREDYDGQIAELNKQLELYHNLAETLRSLGYTNNSKEIQELQKDYLDTQNKILDTENTRFEAEINKNQRAIDAIENQIEDLGENEFDKEISLLNEELPLYEVQLAKVKARQEELTNSFGNVENMTGAVREEMENLEDQAVSLSQNIKEAKSNIDQAFRDRYEYSQDNINTIISNLEKEYELLDLANDNTGKSANRESRINNLTLSIQKAYNEITRLREKDAEKNKDLIQEEIDRVYDATQKILELRKEQYQTEYDELNRYVQMRDSLENWAVGEKEKYIKKTEKLVKQSYAKGLIDAKAYIEQLSEIYTSEFEQYQTEQQRLQQAAISAIEKEIEAIEKAQDKKVDALEEEIDLLEKRKEELEDQLELYDKAKSAVDTFIDEETDKLQEQIDKLEERNNQQTKAIELTEKQQALAKAEQQKSSYIYREGSGWGYDSNAQELADAQKDLWEYNREQQLEAEKQAIQDRIDALNEYKEKWQEAVDAYDKAQDKIAASAIIGAKWEKYVLELREDIVKKFGDEYYALSDELEKAVNDRIEALNKEKEEISDNTSEQIDKLNELKDAWSEALDIQDEIEGYAGGLETLIGAESDSYESRLALAEKFAENYKRTFKDLQETTQSRIESLYEESQSIADLVNKANIPSYTEGGYTSNTDSNTLSNDDVYVLKAMREASKLWAETNDEALRKELAQKNQELSKLLSFNANFDSHTGVWTDDEGRQLYDLLKAYENGETVTVKNTKSQDSNTNATNKATNTINSASNNVSSSTQKNVNAVNSNSKNISTNSDQIGENSNKTDINTSAIDSNTSKIGETITSNNSVIESVDKLTETIPGLKEAFENIDFSSGSNTSSSDLGLNAIADAFGDEYSNIEALVKKNGATLNGNILTLSNGNSYELLGNGNFQRLQNSNTNSSNTTNSEPSTGKTELNHTNYTYVSLTGEDKKVAQEKGIPTSKLYKLSQQYWNDAEFLTQLGIDESNPYYIGKLSDGSQFIRKYGKNGGSSVFKLKNKYAKGTKGTLRDQLALVDEQGEELVVHADKGRFKFLSKGSGVIPHDLTENLMALGKNPTDYIRNTITGGELYKSIIPLSSIVNNKTNGTVVQINGDLSFPNINSGNDAQKLIDALCTMSTKAIQRTMRH